MLVYIIRGKYTGRDFYLRGSLMEEVHSCAHARLQAAADLPDNGGCVEQGHGNSMVVVVVDRKGAGAREIHSCEQGAGDARVVLRHMAVVGSMMDVAEMIGDACDAAEEYASDLGAPTVEEDSIVLGGRVYRVAADEVAEHILESAWGRESPQEWHSAREQWTQDTCPSRVECVVVVGRWKAE